MRCLLYARVSTERQNERQLSIPAQLAAMRDYARQRGLEVDAEYVEPGASARTADRPVLQQLLARVRDEAAGIGVVLVHKIDRLARNVYDHATIKAVLAKHGVRLASVVENVDDTVSGQLVEHIMASLAQFYSANLAEEVKKGMRQRVLKGGWPHLPPRGYVQVRTDGGPSRVEPHPKEAPIIRAAFESYSSGWHSLKSLAAMMHRQGLARGNGRPLGAAQVQRMLTNPFYAGRIRWKEIEADGSHEPAVTTRLFEKVQAVLRRRFKDPGAKGSVNGFPLRGLAICASCRGHMTAGWHKGGRFGYYHCSRRAYDKALCVAAGYTSAKKAHEQAEGVCRSLSLSERHAADIQAAAVRIVEEDQRKVRLRRASLEARRGKLASRELRLTEAFVGGDLTPAAYKPAASKLRAELQALDGDLSRSRKDPAPVLNRVEGWVRNAKSFWDLHQSVNEGARVELLRAAFLNVVLDESGVVGFTLRTPFDEVFRGGGAMDGPAGIAARMVERAWEESLSGSTQ